MRHTLVEYPYFSYHIPPDSYNKEEMLTTMLNNYAKQPSRNEWNGYCDMHHEYDDRTNENMEKVNYDSIVPVYGNIVQQFVDELGFHFPIEWSYTIENYTVTTKAQTMQTHNHLPATFAAVHYLKFDPLVHSSTQFVNPTPYSNVLSVFYRPLHNTLPSFVCVSPDISLTVEEDTVIIFPGHLDHFIPSSKSDIPRVTTAFNIVINEKEQEEE